MKLLIKNLNYHREKEAVPISEPQALLMISDMIVATLAQNGFSAEIETKED